MVFASGVASELMRIVKSRRSLSTDNVGLAVNAINNLSLSDAGQTHFKVRHLIKIMSKQTFFTVAMWLLAI